MPDFLVAGGLVLLVLAAIAVKLIREGIVAILATMPSRMSTLQPALAGAALSSASAPQRLALQ